MQIFLRCPNALGTVPVDADTNDSFDAVLDRIASGRTAECSEQRVSLILKPILFVD